MLPQRVMLLALLMSTALIEQSVAEEQRPNIVFVLLDNVGQEWFGCYGSQENATPHIDRLAAEGVRFKNCYATPYCSTSRAMLLSGRYPHTTGWRFHHDAGIYGGGNFDWHREVTFARILRDAGYATCVAGKWQINNFDEPGQANCLREHGFEEHLVTPGGKNDSKYWDPLVIENGFRSLRQGKFGPDLYTEFVQDFIRRKRESPFLVYLPITLVHTPLPATPGKQGIELSPVDLFRENLRYADASIGRLIETLESLQLRENTIIFISADNGGPPSFPARTDRGTIRGLMGTFVEPSINVPMIVNGPTRIPGGRVASLTDYTDVLPTIAQLTGSNIPADRKLDGHSYADWLQGNASSFERDWIHTALNDERILRDERFKLYSSGGFFDLLNDPNESVDLTDSLDPGVESARRRLKTALQALPEDRLLDFAPNSVASRRYRDDKAAGKSTLLRRGIP
jgi:arylsulfatase A-like enzyme